LRFKKRNFYAPLKFVAGADAQADEWQGGAESREAVALECRQFDLSCGRGDRRG